MKTVIFRNALIFLLAFALLFSIGCVDPDKSGDTSTDPAVTESEAISSMKSFFASEYDSKNKNHVMVIEDLETLNKVCAIADPAPNTSKYLFKGNVKDNNYISTYTKEYFETGYLIAFYKLDSWGNLDHQLSATKKGNTIDLQIKIIEPPIRTADIGAYIYIIAVEGKYNGEEIKTIITKEELRSEGVYYFKSFFESDYTAQKSTAQAFVIEDSEALRQVCAIADPDASTYLFRGNVKDNDYMSTYTEEYFKTGYLIAVYKLDTVGNLSHEISASKDGNTVNVQIKRIEPPIREDMISAYVYITSVEGKYNGEEIKLNVEETAIESVPGETYEQKDY